MPSGLGAHKMYIYYGRSSTFKGGDRSSDKHQAFNPMLTAIDFPTSMKYIIQKSTTCDKLFPNIEYDKQLEEGTVRFKCHYRDPILLATLLTYKGLPTSWSGTADLMTFNFSNLNDIDKNMWVQLHIPDQSGNSNHLDIFLDGGELVSYSISYTQGDPVFEEFQIKFAEINVATETDSTGAYAVNIDDGFDDGSFDQTGVAEITSITCLAKASISDGDYFKLWGANGTGGWTAYYVWMDTTGGSSVDPAPTGFTSVRCDISGATSDSDVATIVKDAIHGLTPFTATSASAIITVTAANTGDVKDCVDVNSGFTISVSTQGVTALDGGWSNWDGDFTSKQCVMANDVTITFGGLAIPDMDIQTFKLEFQAPKTRYRVASSLTPQGSYLGKREPWKCSIDGVITRGNNILAEPSKVIANKAQGTLKMLYGTTKFFQFTLARYEETSAPGKGSGEIQNGTFQINAGADAVLTHSWTADEATDPSLHIEHTNVP